MSESGKAIAVFAISAAAALIAYFGVLPQLLPGYQIDSDITQSEIVDKASETLHTYGYDVSELEPRSALTSSRRAIADFIHSRGRPELNEALASPDHLLPPFYSWEVNWIGPDEDRTQEAEISISISTDSDSDEDFSDPDIDVQFSPHGQLVSFGLSDIAEPAGLNPEVFANIHESPETPVYTFLEEHEPETITVLFDSTTDSETRIEEERLIIGKEDFIQVGSQIIETSYWERFDLEPDSISVDGNNSNTYHSNASLHFVNPDAIEGYQYELQLDLTAGGFPTDLSYEYNMAEPFEKASANYLEIFSGFGPVLIILIVLVLFFIRLNSRLMSPRIVFTDAIIFGLIMLLMGGSNLLAISSDFQFSPETFAISAGVIFITVFCTLAFIPFGATTESLSHESYPEKLYSLTLLRNGFILNPKVGRSLLYGISGGFGFLILVTLLLALDAYSLYPFDQEIPTGILLHDVLSGLVQISNGMLKAMFYTFFVIAPMSFFILAKIKNRYAGIALIITIALLVGGLVPESNHTLIDLAFRALSAAGLTYLILRFDVITLLTAIFSATIILNSKMEIMQPDLNLSSSLLIAITLLFPVIIGLVGVRKNTDDQYLPELRPEYLKKLAEEERIRQGHKLAREVHTSFLPQTLPQIPELDIAANCKPALDVGGDYYDFFKLSDNKLAVAIGDVSGKGIHAAFYMTLIKGYLQSLSRNGTGSAELLKSVHRLFRENARVGTFITLLYGIVDLNNNTFTFARAGHNPLLHFNNNTDELTAYQPDGCAIGMGSLNHFNQTVKEQCIPFESGDSLVLFTDGYPESTNPRNTQLGDEAFQKIIRDNRHHDAATMITNINKEVDQFRKTSRQDDDMTLVIVKRR